MGKSVSFTRMHWALGLAAGLFLGCQPFLGQEDKAPSPAGDATSEAPAEVALKLTMKETDACRALHAQVLAADAAGEAAVTLQTDFIKNCIEEVHSSDAAGKVVIPADLIPDDRTRCRWLVSEIEGGREELVIKFRYYCPAECDTLGLADSARHTLICRDPNPDCAELKAKLAAMDPKSEEYARLRLFLAEHCGARDTVHPPKDTLVAPSRCDSLRHWMAALDPASEEYARLKHMFTDLCVAKPPIDTVRPVLTFCDSLKRRLSAHDIDSLEYQRILALLHEKCGHPDTVVKPVPPNCDSLRKVLAAHPDSLSEEYIKARRLFNQYCGGVPDTTMVKPVRPNCDSLRRVLAAHPDSTSEEYIKARRLFHEYCGEVKPPVDTLPPPHLPLCDSLRLILSTLDPASEEYAWLKKHWYAECVEPKPVDPPSDSIYCEGLLARMKGMDPASADYALLKEQWALHCAVHTTDPIKPVDPVLSECDAIRKKMESVDPASADYAHLKELLAEACGIH